MIVPYNNNPVTRIFSTNPIMPMSSPRINDSLDDDEYDLFLQREIDELESFEELFLNLEEDENDSDDDKANLEELLQLLVNDDDEDDTVGASDSPDIQKYSNLPQQQQQQRGFQSLEQALLEGVVPVSAGVGDDQLPGDYGFDPLHLSTRDTIGHVQRFLWGLPTVERPPALILRDYREAEIRHGRLAMLATVFWPLQEMLDRLLLDEDYGRPLFQATVTLPYFPLIMTGIMLLLGYLDIYSQAVKDSQTGEAFLPADCFWDPLSILDGGNDRMKRNMQERELLVRPLVAAAVFFFCIFIHSYALYFCVSPPTHSHTTAFYRTAASPCLALLFTCGKNSSHKPP